MPISNVKILIFTFYFHKQRFNVKKSTVCNQKHAAKLQIFILTSAIFWHFFRQNSKKHLFIDQTPAFTDKQKHLSAHGEPKDVLQHKVPVQPTYTLFIIILIHGSLNAGQAKRFYHLHRLCKARLQGGALVGRKLPQHIVDLRAARKIITNAKA